MTQSKLPPLIVKNAKKLIQQLVPSIIQITDKTGIRNIGQPNMEMPGSCIPQSELQEILQLKNNLTDKLNSTSKIIESLSKPLDILNTTVTTLSQTLDITKSSKIAANIALGFLPVTPGAAPAAINALGDLIDILDPKIQTTKNTVSSIVSSLDYANNIIFKILNLLKIIDQYLIQCGVPSSSLLSYNEYVNNVEQNYTQNSESNQNAGSNQITQIYNGFVLDIVEEQFSPTVKRIKAIAKNPQGIILLETPPSFTTIPEVLITELKLIIDKSNLKAY
jgi:hypothetical protein